MARVLVVEDSPSQARMIRGLLEPAGHEVRVASNGTEGLKATSEFAPQVVVTDLQMPEMNGLELVDVLRRRHPAIPVVLMTAFGSEDIAVDALKRGAANYVPKKQLAAELPSTVRTLLGFTRSEHPDRLLRCLQHSEAVFLLENDAALVPDLVNHIQRLLTEVQQFNENTLLRIGIALNEAVINAIFHGNLELSSKLREGDGRAFDELAAKRRELEPFASRRVAVCARVSQTEAVVAVRDEGPGFDRSLVPDPRESSNLERLSGRGLFLIQTFLDEVRFNSCGNEITMVKRREDPAVR